MIATAAVKFFVDNWMLIALALSSGTMLLMPTLMQGSAGGAVGTAEAVRLINRERAVLIDVAEPAEYAKSHAAGARNVPLAGLIEAKGLPSNKALPLLVMCATGSRARAAAAQLRKAGYENAKAMAGGLAAWREASLPVESGVKGAA